MTRSRTYGLLLGVIASLVAVVTDAQPALAQGLPLPSVPGLAELLSHPEDWLTQAFHAVLLTISQKSMGSIVGFMDWLMGSGNMISQTPPALSYANDAVKRLWSVMLQGGNWALIAVTAWGGFTLMLRTQIRAPYHGALELIPRVLLTGIMVNFSLDWGRFVIEMNNALCRQIGGAALPGWGTAQQQIPDGGVLLLNLIAMAIYLVMGLLLMGQMMMRLALVDALLVIAPLALVCWVLPQTYGWARLWFNTFFATVFVQSIQVLVLRLGTDMIQSLPSTLSSLGADPGGGWHVWLTTLLLGMAVLQLTRQIPRLIPGPVGGMQSGNAEMNTVRQIGQFLNLGGSKKGRK